MNHEQLKKNLNSVKDEAEALMENVRAVRGEKYAEVVRMLLNIGQMAQVVSGALGIVSDHDEDAARILGTAAEKLLTEIAISGGRISEFDESLWADAVNDSRRMNDNVETMLQTALSTAEQGKGFGDVDG